MRLGDREGMTHFSEASIGNGPGAVSHPAAPGSGRAVRAAHGGFARALAPLLLAFAFAVSPALAHEPMDHGATAAERPAHDADTHDTGRAAISGRLPDLTDRIQAGIKKEKDTIAEAIKLIHENTAEG